MSEQPVKMRVLSEVNTERRNSFDRSTAERFLFAILGGEYMARPRVDIDKDTFEELCNIQCTLSEIAGVFRCSEDTVQRWAKRTYGECFANVHKKYSEGGKTSLRRYQFRLAEKNAAMAIFLGKNYLGQRDCVEYEDKESLARLDAILRGMKDAAIPETE